MAFIFWEKYFQQCKSGRKELVLICIEIHDSRARIKISSFSRLETSPDKKKTTTQIWNKDLVVFLSADDGLKNGIKIIVWRRLQTTNIKKRNKDLVFFSSTDIKIIRMTRVILESSALVVVFSKNISYFIFKCLGGKN